MRARILGLFLILLLSSCGRTGIWSGDRQNLEQIYSDFVTPPQSARPLVWWHWMNGNITKEGIRKDLLWMNSVGIAGFHLFDASLSTPQIVDKRLEYMTPEWNEAYYHAIQLADSLGMEVGVAASPGWSSTGGPWVRNEDGMKKIVWREMVIEGGRKFDGQLPEPYTTSGVYQNMQISNTNGDPRDLRYYTDVAVIAVKLPAMMKTMSQMGAVMTSSGGDFTMEQMTDGDLETSHVLPYINGASWVQYGFPEPQTIRSLTIVRPHKRTQWGATPSYCIDSLQISDNGVDFRTVMGIKVGNILSQTVSFEPVTAKFFRVKSGAGKNSGIAEFVLYPYTKVNHSEEKAAYASPHDLLDNPTPVAAADEVYTEIIDLTDSFVDGKLEWDVPEGSWKVYRFGASLTGKRNHPATLEATGLEVDKINPEAWHEYFKNYLDSYKAISGDYFGQKGLSYLMVDSYEARLCNWTPGLREEFRRRRGYDMQPWLPAMTGCIVSSTLETEKFLWDLRTTLGELFAENFAQIPHIIKNEYGMKGAYVEAHENSRVFVADGMAIKKSGDFPMAAMWMQTKKGAYDRLGEGMADIRESASVADIYGKPYVAAESFTVNGIHEPAWGYSPAQLVWRANMMMSAGLSRFVIHESAHQPVDDKVPGLGLGQYGQWFNRHDTWAPYAKPWIDYLSRNCAILQKGRMVSDILYFYGEDNNVNGLFSRKPADVPEGYNYCFVNSEILSDVLEVRKGKLRAPATGSEYSVLYLHPGQTEVMSLKTLRCIERIAAKGVIVCGNLPERAASMMDSQAEFDEVLKKLRAMENVHEDVSLAELLPVAGIDKDFDGGPLLYVHRTCPSAEIYWVCNPTSKCVHEEVSLRCTGRKPQVWDPMTGARKDVSYRMVEGRTFVELEIDPEAASVIVLGEETDCSEFTVDSSELTVFAELDGTWTVSFEKGRGVENDIVLEELVSLSSLSDPDVRHFSGKSTYRTTISLDTVPAEAFLDLGEVWDMALVRVNGTDAGILWKSPFRTDVSSMLVAGENQIEIDVVNRWTNRLIGDSAKPAHERITYTAREFYKPSASLFPSGLVGPVRLCCP